MKRTHAIILALITGILLSPPWYRWGSGFFLFIAWIPLLHVEDRIWAGRQNNGPRRIVPYALISFASWNFLTTWWIWNASPVGLFAAVIVNSILMSFFFWLFHFTRRKAGRGAGYLALIFYWLIFEHFYLNAEISWPWLNLGNGFAYDIRLVQWYSYTGTLGGTLWVLLVNIMLYDFILRFHGATLKAKSIYGSFILLALAGPMVLSFFMFNNYEEKGKAYDIVVLQPNIDPYSEKFTGMSAKKQTGILLELADSLADQDVDYFVAPETFINNNVWEDRIPENEVIQMFYTFLEAYPKAKFVVGATTYKRYSSEFERTPTSTPLPGTNEFYDSFNTAMQLDSTGIIQLYKKSKLVVGVEKMPYPELFGFLRNLTLRLGGTFRSHGTQEFRSCLYSPRDSLGIGTVICYESVFGAFVTEYIKAGADMIFVITNDGWWGDTPGHRQHHAYSRLRAIETRKSIARSANTGISSFINQKGEVLQSLPYWEKGVIRDTIRANPGKSYYTLHGDYIARVAYFFGLLVFLYALVKAVIRSKNI